MPRVEHVDGLDSGNGCLKERKGRWIRWSMRMDWTAKWKHGEEEGKDR